MVCRPRLEAQLPGCLAVLPYCKRCWLHCTALHTHRHAPAAGATARLSPAQLSHLPCCLPCIVCLPVRCLPSRSYGLDLFLLSIDEGISGYRDDSLETVKRNEQQYQVLHCLPLPGTPEWLTERMALWLVASACWHVDAGSCPVMGCSLPCVSSSIAVRAHAPHRSAPLPACAACAADPAARVQL